MTAHSRQAFREGFTLVELLVVVLIIMILMATLLPTINKVRTEAQIHKSQAIVNMIHSGVLMYRDEVGALPDCCGTLVQSLTGNDPQGSWSNDDDPNIPGQQQVWRVNGGDGKEGPGFRLVPKGTVYGPYNGTEELRFGAMAAGLEYFLDGFGRTILYYRYDPYADGGPKFLNPANYGGPSNEPVTDDDGNALKIDLDDYLQGENNEYYRKDFVIISRGPDGYWGGKRPHPSYPDDPKRFKMYPAWTDGEYIREFDDVTNFFTQ